MNDCIIKAYIGLDKDSIENSLGSILYNITANQFILRDEKGELSIAPHRYVLNKSSVIVASGGSAFWYLYKDSGAMTVEIEGGAAGGSITITPVAPYKMKYGIASEIERIDLSFYLQCCIELCENFLVSDIKAGEVFAEE